MVNKVSVNYTGTILVCYASNTAKTTPTSSQTIKPFKVWTFGRASESTGVPCSLRSPILVPKTLIPQAVAHIVNIRIGEVKKVAAHSCSQSCDMLQTSTIGANGSNKAGSC